VGELILTTEYFAVIIKAQRGVAGDG